MESAGVEHSESLGRPGSDPFLQALKKNRAALNKSFVQHSHVAGGIDGDAFLRHLLANVDPIVSSVGRVMPECTGPALVQLYELSLTLFAQRVIGPDSQNRLVGEAWQRVLPRLADVLARDVTHVAGIITNAVYNLSRQPGVDAELWLERMARLAADCDHLNTLNSCMLVTAWCAGAVQYRSAAIEAARTLEPALVLEILGIADSYVPDQVSEILDHFSRDRWFSPTTHWLTQPARSLQVVGKIGGFRGFDGHFIHPPCVDLRNGCFVAADADSSWQLLADPFGRLLHRFGAGLGNSIQRNRPNRESVAIDAQGNIRWNQLRGTFPAFKTASSWAADEQTLAITLSDSHHVFLLAAV